MAKRRKSRKNRALAADLGLEGFLGLGAIDWRGYGKDAMEAGVFGAGAAVGVIGGELAIAHIPWVKDQGPNVKAGILAALGAVGGIGIAKFAHKGLGVGFASGLIGDAIVRVAIPLANKVLPDTAKLAEPTGVRLLTGAVAGLGNSNGFRGTVVSEQPMLPGLGALTIDTMGSQAFAGLGNASRFAATLS